MCDNIKQRLHDFKVNFEFKRIALTMEQIARLNPPANPVKKTDTRSQEYSRQYGDECWELDSLPPNELNNIIESEIVACIDDMDDFASRREEDAEGRERLRVVGENFELAHGWLNQQFAKYGGKLSEN